MTSIGATVIAALCAVAGTGALAGCTPGTDEIEAPVILTQQISGVALSHDGRLAAVTSEGRVAIVECDSDAKPRSVTGFRFTPSTPTFARNSDTLVVWQGDLIRIDAKTLAKEVVSKRNDSLIDPPRAISDDFAYALGGAGGVVEIKKAKLFRVPSSRAATPTFDYICSAENAGPNQRIKLWRFGGKKIEQTNQWDVPANASIIDASIQTAEPRIALVNGDAIFAIHGGKVRTLSHRVRSAEHVRLTRDGKVLIVLGTTGIQSFDFESGEPIAFASLDSPLRAAVSADGSRIAVVDNHDMLFIYDLPELRLVRRVEASL